jgi:putative transposase
VRWIAQRAGWEGRYTRGMARKLRITLLGLPHHVTSRGNGRHDVFFTPEDRTIFLHLLATAAATYGVSLLGYCLMTNHVHLIATPHQEQALELTCRKLFGQYAAMITTRLREPGHLWQQRYHACVLDDLHLCRALRYVERNPVRAGLVTQPGDYAWSSAAAHLGGADPTGLLDLESWRELWPGTTWADYLALPEAEEEAALIRHHTQIGRPLGEPSFLSWVAAQIGRPLPGAPRGRHARAR